ncbi:hypothetical protein [Clostridium gasigenes]|nr:hypothetical protein [Clostridium gasigenes]MBB6622714.1 hypothetical protein [Clostridium gasigenes]NKF06291.1 hypothetical protein [Clostridium gasigenes]QSW20178.1 hypothetical protein J1C67_02945 [Clostridium gasigenes]
MEIIKQYILLKIGTVEVKIIDDYKNYDIVIIIGENKKDDFRIKQDIRG